MFIDNYDMKQLPSSKNKKKLISDQLQDKAGFKLMELI